MKIVIEGFKDKNAANEFIHWMCNSGEQEYFTALECDDDFDGKYPNFRYEYPDQIKEDREEYKVKISYDNA